jgi:hypothetical protein
MSKGNILIVVNVADKEAIEVVIADASPKIEIVGELCQFSFEDLEVDLTKNADLSELQAVLNTLGEDDYAYCVTVDRLETLDIYGSPKKFGLARVMDIQGYKIKIH